MCINGIIAAGGTCALLLAGCAPGQVNASSAVLEFDTGGAYHPGGAGEWVVRVTGTGEMSVRQQVREAVRDYGTFRLSAGETQALWRAIDEADLSKLRSSTRSGVPDEVQLSLRLVAEGRTCEASVWEDDALENRRLARMAAWLGMLVKRYTKVPEVIGFGDLADAADESSHK